MQALVVVSDEVCLSCVNLELSRDKQFVLKIKMVMKARIL